MHRRREAEWMDADEVDPDQLRVSLRFIERINRRLGYTRALISHLNQFARKWNPGETIHILDIATGSADVPRAVLTWADRRGFPVQITAIDRQAQTLSIARELSNDPRLTLLQADALQLPFTEKLFDYVLCSMFLHHLSEKDAIEVIRSADRLSRRGMIIADLLRSRRACFWIWLFTVFSNPMVRHDARVSVTQAFDREEAMQLFRQAGVQSPKFRRHFAHRWIAATEKHG